MEHYEGVYSLLKAALWGQERYPLTEAADWNAVCQELKDHAVSTLAVDVLPDVPGLDTRLKMDWIQHSTRHVRSWHRLMKEQDAVGTLLRETEIPFVVLKGAAAAMYYPQPEYRAMGDVDLIVLPEDFDRADKLLREHGYDPEDADYERHTEFRKNGVLFELHRRFSDTEAPAATALLDEAIFAGIPKARELIQGTYRTSVLEPLENGLVLLEHIDHHMEAGLGLRQIVDWMLYVDKEVDDEFWDAAFGPWAERLGLTKLAVTVTRMCQLYLGLRQDGITWCAGAEEDLCRELMELTMSRGNFGRKAGAARSAVPLVHAVGKLSNIPRLLQNHGCINWKALKKYPFLKPFAWAYQLCRYVKKIVTGEYPLKRLLADIRTSGAQDDIMTRLGVGSRLKNKFK